ncbi:MAG TPA: AbrB/MazE/SpoVT family DNA-binding domain-containing protein [Candidatus Saccharimonadia bacterium]|jgi:AbrB family looped-hinge helix DNA binding protein|nr:AbrB/MazE/SpoVT family DNA-binding domain-containing protein [Candidatus Saccharimonadia bacterium]
MNKHTGEKNSSMDFVTIGERGQVVIPQPIRESTGLNAGDKLIVFTKHNEMICLVPASSMRRLVDVLTEQLSDLEAPETKSEGK